jgi:perosamine synthetase
MRLPADTDHSGRDLGQEELELLRNVLVSGQLSGRGPQVRQLERDFASRYDSPCCRAFINLSAAVAGCLAVVGVRPGDEVIVSPFAGRPLISAILLHGAAPVFADVDPLTLSLTRCAVAACLSPRTRAITVSHSFGLPADVDAIRAAAPGVPILEDSSQAFLARIFGRPAGTLGELGIFSLHQESHLTAGEGALVLTADDELARRLTEYRDQGSDSLQDEPLFAAPQTNMTELQAAVARAQLCKLEGCVARRQRAADELNGLLIDVQGLTLPIAAPGCTHAYARYVIQVDPVLIYGGAEALAADLAHAGIPSYTLPAKLACDWDIAAMRCGRAHDVPNARRAAQNLLLLPWNEFYDPPQIQFLANELIQAVGRRAEPLRLHAGA